MKKYVLTLIAMLFLFSCQEKGELNSQIAMIMLKESSKIEISAIVDEMKALFGKDLKIEDPVVKENTIVFEHEGIKYGIAEIPKAIPEKQLDFPINSAWYWENAREEIESHKSHLIVFVSSLKKKVELSKDLTMMTAALLNASESLGVYWGPSSQVIQKKFFLEYAGMINEDSLPVPIWVKATGYQNPDESYYIYTIGLKEYGHREFEIRRYNGDISEGMVFIMDLANYVLENGPKIKDGDTVGESEEQKLKAKYKRSSLFPEEDVISILF